MADGELLEQPKLLDPELGRMSSVGVSSLRATLRWNLTVRCAKCRPDFRRFDRIVLGTARRRISVLPVVLGAPAYLAENPDDEVALPRDAADLGAFLRLAVRRYGPDGVLWQQHPEVIPVPIRTWQVWNEPDHELYMPHTQNWPARYVELLKAAAGVDPPRLGLPQRRPPLVRRRRRPPLHEGRGGRRADHPQHARHHAAVGRRA